MDRRSLTGIFRANLPQFVWMSFPLYIGSFIFALQVEDKSPEWVSIILFLITVTVLVGIAQFANTYADQDEDRLYVPSNPLLTGDLDEVSARRAFLLQNILGGLLLIALFVVTLNYWLIIALAIGWAAGLTYSLPPFRFKETAVGPIIFALGIVLKPIVGWLVIGPLNDFMIAFALFFFVELLAFQISGDKLRKTFIALRSGLIELEEGSSIYDLRTVGLKIRVRTAIAIEAMTGLGAFILVVVFWALKIFDVPLTVALLTLPLGFAIVTVVYRMMEPVENTWKCSKFMGMVYAFIILSFFGVALATVLHWVYAILLCAVFFIVFRFLFEFTHSFGEAYRVP